MSLSFVGAGCDLIRSSVLNEGDSSCPTASKIKADVVEMKGVSRLLTSQENPMER
jgi:hypothetical protein